MRHLLLSQQLERDEPVRQERAALQLERDEPLLQVVLWLQLQL